MTLTDSLFITCYYIQFLESVLPLVEVACAVLTMALVKPFVYSNAKILLQTAPEGKQRDGIMKLLRQVNLIDGVEMVKEERFWMLDRETLIGSIHLQVHSDARQA